MTITDKGGPLICEQDGHVVLAGVTSWGIGCARPANPGEWAKVSNYMNGVKYLFLLIKKHSANNLRLSEKLKHLNRVASYNIPLSFGRRE